MKNILLVLLIVCSCELSAQESNQTYGIFGGYNLNIHLANFQKIPDVPNCCPQFKYGYGNGYNFGLLFEQKLSESLSLGTRLEYGNLNATIIKLEPTQVIIGNDLVAGEFEHSITAHVLNYQLSLNIGYNPFADFKISAGLFAGKYNKADYSQYEKITKPIGSGSFLDSLGKDTDRRIRNEFSGSLKDVSKLSYGAILGFSYDIPLNRKRSIKLSPEVNYQYFLNDIAQNIDWKVSSVKIGLALKYTPYNYPKHFKTEEKIDTVRVISMKVEENTIAIGSPTIAMKSEIIDDKEIITQTNFRTDTLFVPKPIELRAIVTVVGVDTNNVEIKNPKYVFEQFVSNRHQPMLNYIFFDSTSSKLPVRYKKLSQKEVKDFNVDKLSEISTLETYYHVLNIIGQRMITNPTAKIKLVGCNSNTGKESGNLNLSRSRSNEVRDYLVSVWKINTNRIYIEAKNLSQLFSYPAADYEKSQENRRVELSSNNPELLKPVFISDTITKASPSKARFYIETVADLPIKNWTLTLQNDASTRTAKLVESGNGTPPKSIDMLLKEDDKIISKNQNKLVYDFNLTDERKNNFNTGKNTLNVETISVDNKRRMKVGDIEINKYNLILFDFTSSNIYGNNAKIIDLVKSKLTKNAKVKIVGYTDRSGDAESNRKLSLQRAQSANKLLPGANATVEGEGEDILLYNNDFPEGRFYSRTVEIIVESPIENK